MFKVGDRVEIVKANVSFFQGATGTIVSNHMTHIYEGYQVFHIRLDKEVELPLSKEIVHYYPASAQEIALTDVPPPQEPKKKRKWWQWGY